MNVGNNAATGIPAQDRDGKNRILVGTVDLGAYETGPRMLLVPQHYSTIQAAIEAATTGDTVLVDDGIHSADFSNRLFFNGKAITVRSVNGPRNCIITSSSNTSVYFGSTDKAGAVLQGFTFQGTRTRATYYGGAIYCSVGSSPTILDCVIRDNVNSQGPAGISCFYASPTIVNCTISRNIGFNGAGIMCWISSPVITNCTIVDNHAYTEAGHRGDRGRNHQRVRRTGRDQLRSLGEFDQADSCRGLSGSGRDLFGCSGRVFGNG